MGGKGTSLMLSGYVLNIKRGSPRSGVVGNHFGVVRLCIVSYALALS